MGDPLKLDKEHLSAVMQFLREPFNTLNNQYNINPATGKGYPGITVREEDRDGNGVPDQWIVDFSIDSKDGRRKKLNPDNGYLIEESTVRVEQVPGGTGKMVVVDGYVRCSSKQGAPICDRLLASNTNIASAPGTRLAVNSKGVSLFIKKFVEPHYREISATDAISGADFARMKAEAEENARAQDDAAVVEEAGIASLFVLGATAVVAVVQNLTRPDDQEETGDRRRVNRLFAEQRSARAAQRGSEAPLGTDLPASAYTDEAGRTVQDLELGELFLKDTKQKLVGRIEVVAKGESWSVQFTDQKTGASRIYQPSEILTMRDRTGDLNDQYIRVPDPQFKDKSVNQSGVTTARHMVVTDFSDPRLVRFLEQHMSPIRNRLAAGELTEREAAEQAWKVVSEHVPYDQARVIGSIPNKMYSLGDFIQKGVCNERGMLLQVSLQYIGIDSRMEKGKFGLDRHAWVRATPKGGETVILDPQDKRIYTVGKDGVAVFYKSDSVRFDREKAQTVYLRRGEGDSSVSVAADDAEATVPDATDRVTPDTVIYYLQERFPALADTKHAVFVSTTANEILLEWNRQGRPRRTPTSSDFPPDTFIKQQLDAALTRQVTDQGSVAAAELSTEIQREGGDKGGWEVEPEEPSLLGRALRSLTEVVRDAARRGGEEGR